MPQVHYASDPLCHRSTMPLTRYATGPLCLRPAMPQVHYASDPLCHRSTMPQTRHAAGPLCHWTTIYGVGNLWHSKSTFSTVDLRRSGSMTYRSVTKKDLQDIFKSQSEECFIVCGSRLDSNGTRKINNSELPLCITRCRGKASDRDRFGQTSRCQTV
ncbi:hypothetical protein ACOMHN_021085 [Nucella lapillus]